MSSTLRPVIIKHALPALLLCLFSFGTSLAQTTSFTYQGRLTDAGVLANGPYDIEFKLFDNADVQQGPNVTHEDVALVDGSFVVILDFGDVFDGAQRFLEIGVRPGDSVDDFLILNPRWPITSTPYAIRSIKATNADTATNATTAETATTATDAAQLGGVAADQYVKTDDPRLENGGPPAPGSPDYIQNTTAPQADSNFNVSGNGTLAGTLSASNVGIGTATPMHRLSIAGGPTWTTNSWAGGMDLTNGSAIAWQTNVAGQRAGIGHTNGGFLFFRTASNPGTAVSPAIYDLTINDVGNVGIGTTNPTAGIKLDVAGNVLITPNSGSIQFGSPGSETGMSISRINRADVRFDGSTLKMLVGPIGGPPGPTQGIVVNTVGNVGVGAVAPLTKLHVVGSAIRYENGGKILDITTGSEIDVVARTSQLILQSQATNGLNDVILNPNANNGRVGVGTFRPQTKLHVVGTTRTSVLEIVGGADLSENFDVNGITETGNGEAKQKVVAGMVVSIDPIMPGKLILTTRAYDRRVAGIISGAGGVQTGMMMGHEGTLADGKYPVALSGRVYVWVDAAHGAVKPGDMLTTSPTRGHAMRVTNRNKARGAIIGKAMTGLRQGQGLVLALVTLQ